MIAGICLDAGTTQKPIIQHPVYSSTIIHGYNSKVTEMKKN